MRYVVGILEALLALAFFGALISQLISGNAGFAVSAVEFLAGSWFAKLAVGNFKARKSDPKSEPMQSK